MQYRSHNNIQCDCFVCQEVPHQREMKTTSICVLILKSLHFLIPTREFFSLKYDVNDFIEHHWPILSTQKQFQRKNWRKSILDSFNHCPAIESGIEHLNKRGFYRLKQKEGKHCKLGEYENKCEQQMNQYQKDEQMEQEYGLMTLKDEIKYNLESLVDQMYKTQRFLMKMNAIHSDITSPNYNIQESQNCSILFGNNVKHITLFQSYIQNN